MSDTPRTDAALSRIMKQRKSAIIGAIGVTDLARLSASLEKELSHYEYDRREINTERIKVIHENVRLETELAEARAEIERLKAEVDRWRKESLSKDDARLNLRSAADSIKYWTKQAFDKDKLIEQMRELLQSSVEDWAHKFNHDENPAHGGWAVRAGKILNELQALSAAERGE